MQHKKKREKVQASNKREKGSRVDYTTHHRTSRSAGRLGREGGSEGQRRVESLGRSEGRLTVTVAVGLSTAPGVCRLRRPKRRLAGSKQTSDFREKKSSPSCERPPTGWVDSYIAATGGSSEMCSAHCPLSREGHRAAPICASAMHSHGGGVGPLRKGAGGRRTDIVRPPRIPALGRVCQADRSGPSTNDGPAASETPGDAVRRFKTP
jgi:hypothetical protein